MTLAAISFVMRGLKDTPRSLCAFSSLAGSLPAAATGGDHSQRTALNYRHNVVSEATVLEMKQESPSVKSLLLKVHDNRVMFKAGQWCVFFNSSSYVIYIYFKWSMFSSIGLMYFYQMLIKLEVFQCIHHLNSWKKLEQLSLQSRNQIGLLPAGCTVSVALESK